MSRKTLASLLVVVLSALLALALFIAGAIWRGRVYRSSKSKPASTLLLRASCEQPVETDGRRLNQHSFRFNRRKVPDLFIDTLRQMVTPPTLPFERLTA